MQILLNLCIALLLTMLFFVIGIEGSKYGKWCRAAAILIHYFALSSVMWYVDIVTCSVFVLIMDCCCLIGC